MPIVCETCEGRGQVISERSLRQGHTHGNDPDREDVDCEDCRGTGEREPTASDLDGQRARYFWLTGFLTWNRVNDTLSIEDEDNGVVCVNLQPEHVQCLS